MKQLIAGLILIAACNNVVAQEKRPILETVRIATEVQIMDCERYRQDSIASMDCSGMRIANDEVVTLRLETSDNHNNSASYEYKTWLNDGYYLFTNIFINKVTHPGKKPIYIITPTVYGFDKNHKPLFKENTSVSLELKSLEEMKSLSLPTPVFEADGKLRQANFVVGHPTVVQ